MSVHIFDGNRPVSSFIFAINRLPLDDAEKLRLCLQRLSPAVKSCIESVQKNIRERMKKCVAWTWNLQTLALYGIEEQISGRGSNNDGDAIVKAATAIGVTAIAYLVAPRAIRSLLGVAGFSVAGVVANSIATGIQSTVHGASVPAGSTFAACQSAATGAGVTTARMVGSAAAGAAAAMGAGSSQVSKTWMDGVHFRPSQKLLDMLINAVNSSAR